MEFQNSGITSESKKVSFFPLKEDHDQPNVYGRRQNLPADSSACTPNSPFPVSSPPAEQMEAKDIFFSRHPLSASPSQLGAQHHVSEPAGGVNISSNNRSYPYCTNPKEVHPNPTFSAKYHTMKSGYAIQGKSAICSPAKPASYDLPMQPITGRQEVTPRKRKRCSETSAPPQKFAPTTSPGSIMKDSSTDLRSTEPVSPKKTPEICLSHIWKHCKLGDTCTNMHYHMPYRWQVCNGSEWGDLPGMEDIERAYSEPGNDSFQNVNFQTMTAETKPVRRLSTTSSVIRPPEFVLTTEWIWYWKDEHDIWVEYGNLRMQNKRAPPVSSDLEKIYLLNPTGIIPFTTETHNYVINCKEMKQKNILFNTERKICRRPKFLDYKNVLILKGCTKFALNEGTYPRAWDMEDMPESGYKKVCIPESSDEFLKIVTMFKKTVSGYTVKKLWRNQNSFLWKAYQLQKEKMKTSNSVRKIHEQQLFHGTRSTNIDAICSENFDWRVCGTNAFVFGQGSYFARDAFYSHSYSLPTPSGMRMMIVARVLVGDSVEGNSTMKLPPQKPNSSQRYDSCVNNVHDPSIFVVFDKLQVYPEYILEYGVE